MENVSDELNAAPGQLWRNVRTGDVLFIYRKNGQIEGVFGDGKRKSNLEVVQLAKCSNGWTCVFQRTHGECYDVQDPRFQ